MKVTILLLAALVVAASADDFDNRARENFVNSVNAARQRRVNDIAEGVGASSGTARRDGVPGAADVYGYADPYAYGYPYDGYRYPYPYPAVYQ